MVTLEPARPDLRGFFDAFDSDDIDASADLFHEQFITLDPSTVSVVTREQLRAALPMRAQMFKSIGATGTRLREMYPQMLDDRHVLARARWDVVFADDSAAPMELESSFLLREIEGRWQVLTYLNHHDIAALIAKRQPTE